MILPFVVIFCILLDQITKLLAQEYLKGKSIEIFPFLDFTLVYNRGFAFGLFHQTEGILKELFYYGIPLIVVFALLGVIVRIKDNFLRFAVALILSGGIGNLIDRLFLGRVRDFIDFHIGKWHYPAFNVADVCVSLGMAMLIFYYLFKEKGAKRV